MIHSFRTRPPQKLKSALLLWFLLCSVCLAVHAQVPDDVIRVDSSLVQLNVGVVTRQGYPVLNLSQQDFAVYEDGVRQSIQHFEPTEQPFSLVLLLDVSGSTITFRDSFKQAAYRFLDALRPEDRVEVVAFNEKIKTISSFTTNRRKTAEAIQLADGKGQTEFYRALGFAIDELAKEGPRRKAIVVMTDGIDSNLRKSDHLKSASATTDTEAIAMIHPENSPELQSVLSAADKLGVTVYPMALPSGDPKHIALPDPQIIASYVSARSRLELLATRTGGELNAINRLDELAKVYVRVAADLRTLYTIAYKPEGGSKKAGWHDVRIEVTQPDLLARTRPGYFGR